MANCSKSFEEFNTAIRLTESRRKSLKGSRKELRRKIIKYFDEEKPKEIKPKFSSQGSLAMDTIVNPIPRKETVGKEEKTILYYDVDDGAYFIGDEAQKDRKSIQTYHTWILDAVKGHTEQDPLDKNTCVRVLFADGHNIDIPIYYKNGSIPELAHKRDGWIESDPQAFSQWFNQKAEENDQLRRLVRYMKAWKDYREFSRKDKPLPSGLIFTILTVNSFYPHERDDVSLKETLVRMEAALSKNFECLRPTTPASEDLLNDYNNKDHFLEVLRKFLAEAKKALEEKNKRKSCEYWQNQLGERFTCSTVPNEDEDTSATKGLATGGMSSKPWSL